MFLTEALRLPAWELQLMVMLARVVHIKVELPEDAILHVCVLHATARMLAC
jgi:hypothetical protein